MDKNKKNEDSITNVKPNICNVLNVDVDQPFMFRGKSYIIPSDVMPGIVSDYHGGEAWILSDDSRTLGSIVVSDMINNPSEIHVMSEDEIYKIDHPDYTFSEFVFVDYSHGQWVYNKYRESYVCNKCGCIPCADLKKLFYCPSCGARMNISEGHYA